VERKRTATATGLYDSFCHIFSFLHRFSLHLFVSQKFQTTRNEEATASLCLNVATGLPACRPTSHIILQVCHGGDGVVTNAGLVTHRGWKIRSQVRTYGLTCEELCMFYWLPSIYDDMVPTDLLSEYCESYGLPTAVDRPEPRLSLPVGWVLSVWESVWARQVTRCGLTEARATTRFNAVASIPRGRGGRSPPPIKIYQGESIFSPPQSFSLFFHFSVYRPCE